MGKKITILLGFFILLLTVTSHVWAAPDLPKQTKEPIQDEADFVSDADVERLTDMLNEQNWRVKVVVVEDTSPLPAPEYAKRLFEEYELEPHALAVVYSAKSDDLAAWPGAQLIEAGLDQELLHQKTDIYFVPYANQGTPIKGIEVFLQESYNEIADKLSEIEAGSDGETAANAEDSNTRTGGRSFFGFLLLNGKWIVFSVIALLLVLVIFGIYGMFRRYQILSSIDDVDEWLEAISQRVNSVPVRGQWKETKGETKAQIEKIMQSMKDMMQRHLPDIEAELLEIEEACDRFRFMRASRLLQQTEEKLHHLERELEQMEFQLQEIKEKKEDTQRLWEEAQKDILALEKKLDEIRFTYGYSFFELKEQLEQSVEVIERLKEGEQKLDPLKSHQWLADLKEKNQHLSEILQRIPEWHKAINVELEKDLRQLTTAYNEFLEKGYGQQESGLEEKINGVKHSWETLSSALQEGRLIDFEEEVESVRKDIHHAYEQMEQAVGLRMELAELLRDLPQRLEAVKKENEEHMQIFQQISQEYQVDHDDALTLETLVNKEYEEISGALKELEQLLFSDSMAPAEGKVTLEELEKRIVDLERKQKEQTSYLNDMKKDEQEARNKLDEMKKTMVYVEQKLRRSQLPGIPEFIANGKAILRETIEETEFEMQKVPIPVSKIRFMINEGLEQAASIKEKVDQTIAACEQAEQTIQYGNRYRSRYPEVNNLLIAAELAFRKLDFQKSLQLAEEAVFKAEEREGTKKTARRNGKSA